jgi:hypothetical protein
VNVDSVFGQIPVRAWLTGWGIMLIPFLVVVLLIMLVTRREPMANALVVGCYAARQASAPWLLVEPARIRVGGEQGRSFTYAVETSQFGYYLSVSPALALKAQADGSHAFINQRGIGYMWRLLPNSSDPADLRNPEDYSGRFLVPVLDNRLLEYVRTENAHTCQ